MQLNTRKPCSVQVDKTKKSNRRTRTPGTDEELGLIQRLRSIGYCRVQVDASQRATYEFSTRCA
jgi:hypothetical protein